MYPTYFFLLVLGMVAFSAGQDREIKLDYGHYKGARLPNDYNIPDIKLRYKGCLYSNSKNGYFWSVKAPSYEVEQIEHAVEMRSSTPAPRNAGHRFLRHLRANFPTMENLFRHHWEMIRQVLLPLKEFMEPKAIDAGLERVLHEVQEVMKEMDRVIEKHIPEMYDKDFQNVLTKLFPFNPRKEVPFALHLRFLPILSAIYIAAEFDWIEVLESRIASAGALAEGARVELNDAVGRFATSLYSFPYRALKVGPAGVIKDLVSLPFNPTHFDTHTRNGDEYHAVFTNGTGLGRFWKEGNMIWKRTTAVTGHCTFAPMRNKECIMDITYRDHTEMKHSTHGLNICYLTMREFMNTYQQHAKAAIQGHYDDVFRQLIPAWRSAVELLETQFGSLTEPYRAAWTDFEAMMRADVCSW